MLWIDMREETAAERSFPLVFVPIDGQWRAGAGTTQTRPRWTSSGS
jgi:hypothetical protein